tara:strand:- start:11 stop:1777 length:1767 start_codon:yes stop_codon:yes gene_type:complete
MAKVEITVEVDGIKKTVNSLKDAEKAMKDLGKETKKVAEENKFLADIKGKFADFKSGIKGATAGFKGLKGAIAATGIGLLLIAITSLVAYFKNSEEGSKKLAIAMEAIGIIVGKITDFFSSLGEKMIAVFSNPKQAILDLKDLIVENITNRITSLIDTFGFLGSAIKKVFSGDFSGALDDAKAAGSSYVDSLTGVKDTINKVGEAAVEFGTSVVKAVTEAINVADKLVTSYRLIRDQQQKLIVENAELNKQMETQQRIAEDTTRGYEERKAALEKVGEAQVKLANNLAKQAKLEEYNLNLQIQQEGNYEKREELETSLAEATATRIDAETALETKKLEVGKITAELDAEELARKVSIQEMIDTLRNEDIENQWTKLYADLAIQEEQALAELTLLKATEAQKQAVKDSFAKKREKTAKEEAKFNKAIKKAEHDAELDIAIAGFSAISQLAGESSAVGKAAAIAATTINTYKGAQSAYADTPGGPIIKGIAAAIAVATGVMSVKKIISTKIPGGGSSRGGGGSVPSMPTAPAIDPTVALEAAGEGQDQNNEVTLGGQSGSTGGVMRAYVVSSEMSTQQEADAKINDLARL